VSYLELAGLVTGGWMMARAAHLVQGRADPFAKAKLASATFYARQLLPRASTLAEVVVDGSGCIAELDSALL
jgi:hypothetical protein